MNENADAKFYMQKSAGDNESVSATLEASARPRGDL
jgi:hypothetical protein